MFYVLLFGRGRGPRPNSKNKNTHPPKHQKHAHAPAPSERVFFAVWTGGRVYSAVWAGIVFFFFRFCCLGGVGGERVCFFCLLFGRVRVFLLFGGSGGWLRFFFAVWAGWIFFFLFGRGTGVHSLTGLPGSSLSDPTTKKTKQQKNMKHGFRECTHYFPTIRT